MPSLAVSTPICFLWATLLMVEVASGNLAAVLAHGGHGDEFKGEQPNLLEVFKLMQKQHNDSVLR